MQQPIGDFRPRSRGDLRGGEIESEELPTVNFLVATSGNYGGVQPLGMVRFPRGPLYGIYMARHMRREDWTCGHANRQIAGGARGNAIHRTQGTSTKTRSRGNGPLASEHRWPKMVLGKRL